MVVGLCVLVGGGLQADECYGVCGHLAGVCGNMRPSGMASIGHSGAGRRLLMPGFTLQGAPRPGACRSPAGWLQGQAYKHCMEQWGSRHTFIGFIDLDEFLVLYDPGLSSVNDLLRDYEQFPGLSVRALREGGNTGQPGPARVVMVSENYFRWPVGTG